MDMKGNIKRETKETKIEIGLNVTGSGVGAINSGVGFMDHMLELFTSHGRFDINLSCKGDTNVDYHHSVEDIGIALGKAFLQALGEGRGIKRYGSFIMPMDEALVLVALDISGRACLNYDVALKSQKVGDFDVELAEEFLLGLCRAMGLTLHIKQLAGSNTHHILEAIFKALARALSEAVSRDDRIGDAIPSSKGVLL